MTRRLSLVVPMFSIAVLAAALAFAVSSGGHHDLHSHGQVIVDPAWSRAHPGPYIMTITLLLDEEWQADAGDVATAQLGDVMERVRDLFLPAGILSSRSEARDHCACHRSAGGTPASRLMKM